MTILFFISVYGTFDVQNNHSLRVCNEYFKHVGRSKMYKLWSQGFQFNFAKLVKRLILRKYFDKKFLLPDRL
ncbi:hypothetical protein D7D25_15300 [Proteiniphilum sp. X52]|nr:hypothetical protein D7D25_15300 [Proteiniphilum sp. X52]